MGAWEASYARRRRALNPGEARAQALQAMAQVLQQRLPDLAIKPVPSLTLESFLSQHYEPGRA